MISAQVILIISAAMPGSVLTQQEIEESTSFFDELYFSVVTVDSFPDSLLSSGESELDLIPIRSADTTDLLAAAQVPGGWVVIDTLTTYMDFNLAKSWAWWDSDRQVMVLASQMPFRMLTFYTEWQLAEDGFEIADEYWEDPSEEALASTEALLDSGLVEQAAERLFDVFYPGWYYVPEEMAGRFLKASWIEARRRADAGDWEGALGVYFAAGDAYEQCVLDGRWFLDAARLRNDGNPIELYMDSDTLLTILGHIEMVADSAGDMETAARAAAAAESLSVWMDL